MRVKWNKLGLKQGSGFPPRGRPHAVVNKKSQGFTISLNIMNCPHYSITVPFCPVRTALRDVSARRSLEGAGGFSGV